MSEDSAKTSETDTPLECHFCDSEVPGVEAAIEAGWIPSFYDGDDEVEGPVCPDCINEHLELDEYGEWVRATKD